MILTNQLKKFLEATTQIEYNTYLQINDTKSTKGYKGSIIRIHTLTFYVNDLAKYSLAGKITLYAVDVIYTAYTANKTLKHIKNYILKKTEW